jgi:PIN domain nuclease of toxin-antitoxin system
MTLMLDTHILAWLASNRDELTAGERAAIEQHHDGLLVSAASIWELRLRWRSNPRRAADDLLIKPNAALLFCASRQIEVLPITPELAARPLEPLLPHKDPFDELLLVHAEQAGARLLTRDGDMVQHPLAYHP